MRRKPPQWGFVVCGHRGLHASGSLALTKSGGMAPFFYGLLRRVQWFVALNTRHFVDFQSVSMVPTRC